MSKFEEYIKNQEEKLSFLNDANKNIYKYISKYYTRDTKGDFVFSKNTFIYYYVLYSLNFLFEKNGVDLSRMKPEASKIIKDCNDKLNDDWNDFQWKFLASDCNINGLLDFDTLRLLMFKEPVLRTMMTEFFGEELINEQIFPKNENTLAKLKELKEVYAVLIEKRQVEGYSPEEVKQKYLDKLDLVSELDRLKKEREELEKVIQNGGMYTLETHPVYPLLISKISTLENEIKSILECEDKTLIEKYRSELIPQQALQYENDYDHLIKAKAQDELDQQGKTVSVQLFDLNKEKEQTRLAKDSYEMSESSIDSLTEKIAALAEFLTSSSLTELESLDAEYSRSNKEFIISQKTIDRVLGIEGTNNSREKAISEKSSQLFYAISSLEKTLEEYQDKLFKLQKKVNEYQRQLDEARAKKASFDRTTREYDKALEIFNNAYNNLYSKSREIVEVLNGKGFNISDGVYRYETILNELKSIRERLEKRLENLRMSIEEQRTRDGVTSLADYADKLDEFNARETELREVSGYQKEVENNPEYYNIIEQAMIFADEDHPRR